MRLWSHREALRTVAPITPLLASWEKKTHPAQIRLQAYLKTLAEALEPFPEGDLSLHMEIDVEKPERLLRHYDLENYLTPVVAHLGARRFHLVSAEKYVGGGSRLIVGSVASHEVEEEQELWQRFSCVMSGSVQRPEWKKNLRTALANSKPSVLPPGPADVRLGFRCMPTDNWVSFWKPAGDAMGPVLGEPNPATPFNPNDDRITHLELHRETDSSMDFSVEVGMWWRPAAPRTA
jgi:hypothetical protein